MARIFITGAADGLGKLSAMKLVELGHQVVLHARNAERGNHALKQVPGAMEVLIGDLSSIDDTKALASKANISGQFDAVIHNAGVYRIANNSVNKEGLSVLFAVNSLAPYILTCLIQKPKRIIYLSSGMHLQGDPDMDKLAFRIKESKIPVNYSDTKLHDVILTMAVARRWQEVYSNAVNPGWVPTKMGGAGAPDNLEKGFQTQVWLAVSNDEEARVSGHYFHHKKHAHYLSVANNVAVQEKFLALCENITGIKFE